MNRIKNSESFSRRTTQLIIAAHNCHTYLNSINIICRYQRVFFLLPIEEYNSSMVRMESSNEAMVISQEVKEAYKVVFSY